MGPKFSALSTGSTGAAALLSGARLGLYAFLDDLLDAHPVECQVG
jgi:hypothetical protein